MQDLIDSPDYSLLDTDRDAFIDHVITLREDLIGRFAAILDAAPTPEALVQALDPILAFYNPDPHDEDIALLEQVRASELGDDEVLLERYVAHPDGDDEIHDDMRLTRTPAGPWWFTDEPLPTDDRTAEDLHEHVAYHMVGIFPWGEEWAL